MINPPSKRIMMISTHGYVSGEPEFGRPDTGGQVVYVLELSKCLARMGYSVDILTRQFEEQTAVDELGERIRIVRLPCGGRRFIPKEFLCDAIPEWVENVSRWMRAERLQYGLINSHYWDAGLAGQALANRFDNVHVHTPHSIGAWKRDQMDCSADEKEKKYNFSTRICEEKVIYDECDLLIATTPVQRDILVGDDYDTPLDKIHVIPPGYDDQRFFPVSLATRRLLKQQLDLQGSTILALGRMAKNKGYDLLLRAMPTVLKRVSGAKLILAIGSTNPTVGEQAIRSSLIELADELQISEHVVFGDYIHDDDLPSYYRAADVFALSSRYEPFGMTAVEAMACGTPTVVTTEGGLCEQVAWGIEALHANPFDPEAFGHAIVSVLQQSAVSSRLSKYGPRKARSCFTWTGIAQQLLEFLEVQQSGLAIDCVVPLELSNEEEALWIA